MELGYAPLIKAITVKETVQLLLSYNTAAPFPLIEHFVFLITEIVDAFIVSILFIPVTLCTKKLILENQ